MKTSREMGGDLELPVGGGYDDRLSDLPDGLLEQVLSFLPAEDAVRTSVLSRRWRRPWTHAPALNLSDEQLQYRFLGFAGAVVSRYGAPDIPALDVTVGCQFNLCPGTAALLRDTMERVVDSIRVSVTAPGPLDELTLPSRLRAKSIDLTLSGITFKHGPLVLPKPGGSGSAAFGGLMELSLSRVRLQECVRPLGEFLSSCCPQLRKLRLSKVSGGLTASWGHSLWSLLLHLDQLEELEIDRVESLSKLQVVSANLLLLAVHFCFESVSQWRIDTVVEISAPRLNDVSWSGLLPKHLNFLAGSHCIRRLSGLCFYLPGKEFRSASAVRLLGICNRADHVNVCIDIPDCTTPSMLTREGLDHVPYLSNIRVLSLKLVAVFRFISCPIAPFIFSLLKQCPNLTWLHIDLSMLHQFSRSDAQYLIIPDTDEAESERPWRSANDDTDKEWRDQMQLGSLQEIRISGFMGTNREMEFADLLFLVGAASPALKRISVLLFPQLRQCMDVYTAKMLLLVPFPQLLRHLDGICAKTKARFPLAGGCWETNLRKALIWTRTHGNI